MRNALGIVILNTKLPIGSVKQNVLKVFVAFVCFDDCQARAL